MFVSLDPEFLRQRGIIYWGLFKLWLLHRSLQPRCQLTLMWQWLVWRGQLATQRYTRTTCSCNIGHQTGTRWWQHLNVITIVTFTSALFELDIRRKSCKICIWFLEQYGSLSISRVWLPWDQRIIPGHWWLRRKFCIIRQLEATGLTKTYYSCWDALLESLEKRNVEKSGTGKDLTEVMELGVGEKVKDGRQKRQAPKHQEEPKHAQFLPRIPSPWTLLLAIQIFKEKHSRNF